MNGVGKERFRSLYKQLLAVFFQIIHLSSLLLRLLSPLKIRG